MAFRPQLRSSKNLLRLASEPPASRRLAQIEAPVHVLVIERQQLKDTDGRVLEIPRQQQRQWLEQAANHGLSLMIVGAPDALELYSNAKDRVVAFRPAIESLQQRLLNRPTAGRASTKQLSGTLAAERLLARAAGLVGEGSSGPEPVSLVHGAASLASAHDTLGPILGSLAWAAAAVAQRVQAEGYDAAGRQKADDFEVRRIVEEELARWRTELAELRRSLLPPDSADEPPGPFPREEAGSLIRIKVLPALRRSSGT